jgi:serine/threonine protein kinase
MQGSLSDGTVIAVKLLSSKSKQGNREFVNEIGMISALQHPNLVKLYGCCVEGNQLMIVYEYMENNCLSRALLGELISFFYQKHFERRHFVWDSKIDCFFAPHYFREGSKVQNETGLAYQAENLPRCS